MLQGWATKVDVSELRVEDIENHTTIPTRKGQNGNNATLTEDKAKTMLVVVVLTISGLIAKCATCSLRKSDSVVHTRGPSH